MNNVLPGLTLRALEKAALQETEEEVKRMQVVEDYLKTLGWSEEVDDYVVTLVNGNIRGFYYYLHENGFLNNDGL